MMTLISRTIRNYFVTAADDSFIFCIDKIDLNHLPIAIFIDSIQFNLMVK